MFTVRWTFTTVMSEGRYEVFDVLIGGVIMITRSPVTAVETAALRNSGT